MKLPFINKTNKRNKFIKMEILSKTYISASFLSLPPQAISYEIILKIIHTWKRDTIKSIPNIVFSAFPEIISVFNLIKSYPQK